MKDHKIENSQPGKSGRPIGDGLWTEENSRRLLQAAMPVIQPDPALLRQVEQRVVARAPLYQATFLRQRFQQRLLVLCGGYLSVLILSGFLGIVLRSNVDRSIVARDSYPLYSSAYPNAVGYPPVSYNTGKWSTYAGSAPNARKVSHLYPSAP